MTATLARSFLTPATALRQRFWTVILFPFKMRKPPQLLETRGYGAGESRMLATSFASCRDGRTRCGFVTGYFRGSSRRGGRSEQLSPSVDDGWMCKPTVLRAFPGAPSEC